VNGKCIDVPGAVGPALDVWTCDDPPGAYKNELWAVNASSRAIQTLCTGPPPSASASGSASGAGVPVGSLYLQCITAL
jgi:hypothetical protein